MTSLPIMWFAMYDYAYAKDNELVKYVELPFEELESKDNLSKDTADSKTKQDKDDREVWRKSAYEYKQKALNHPDKDSLMQNPNHYAIGIVKGKEQYSILIFLEVFIRGAIVDAFVIYRTVFYPIA